MLQAFGEHIRGWIAGVVIVIIALAFVVFGLQYYITDMHGSGANAIAIVNGQNISQMAFSQQVQSSQTSAEKKLGRALNTQEQLQLKMMTLNQMIGQLVVTQAVQKDGLNISLEQTKALLATMPQFQVNGHFSDEAFDAALGNMGYTSVTPFLERVRGSFLSQQFSNGVRGSAFVLPNEIQEAYALLSQKRNFTYTILPVSSYLTSVGVSSAAIKQYYQSHQSDYILPEKVKLQYIVLSRSSLEKQVQVTNADLKAAYEDRVANFTTPARWHIARVTTQNKADMKPILAQLKSGKSILDLKKSNKLAVVTQWISAADASDSLANVLNGLKVKQVSHELPTNGAVTVVELLAKEPARAQSFASVRAEIKKRLIEEKVSQLMPQQAETLSNLAFNNASLAPAATALKVKIQVSPFISRNGLKKGIFSDQSVLTAAFSQDVLKARNNSSPISLADGNVIVLRVSKYVASHLQPLADVKTEVMKSYKQDTANREAGLAAYKLQAQWAKDPALVKHKPGMHWQTHQNVDRQNKTINAQIKQLAFSTPPNKTNTVELQQGYVVLRVGKVMLGDWKLAKKTDKLALENNLSGLMGANDLQIYMRQLQKNAKVVIKDKQLVNSWG